MKRILLAILFLASTCNNAQAAKTLYYATGLCGGASYAIDSYDGSGLEDNDFLLYYSGATSSLWQLDSSSGATEDCVEVIAPEANAGTKRWIKQATSPVDLYLINTIHATEHGIIYKGSNPFISDFNYGYNGVVTTDGGNFFSGENAGNLTMGSTATETYHSSYNSFVGTNAGYSNTTGYSNAFIGYRAGYSNTTGYSNAFIGYRAGYFNTTGDNNSFIGYRAGYSNTTGYENSFIGYRAGNSNTTGYENSFVGTNAGYSNTTGYENSFVGTNAGYSNTTGYENSFIGYQAGYFNTTGYSNAFIGYQAGRSNTTGSANSFLGVSAGRYLADGSSPNETGGTSLFLGNETKALADGQSNQIVIGYNTTGNGSNTATIGNTSIVSVHTSGGIVPAKKTSDPCGSYPEGALFYNDTSNYYCYCDGTNDVQMHDPTTACF